MYQSPRVLIVIPFWNNSHLTCSCIASINKLNYSNFEVIVCDNQSDPYHYRIVDDFISSLDDFRFTLLSTGSNLGYGFACNYSITYKRNLKCNYDFYWFINNDTLVDDKSLDILVEFAINNQSFGILGSSLIYLPCKSKIQALGGKYNKYLALSSHIFNMSDVSCLDHMPYCFTDIDYVVGASLFCSRSCITKISGFDESFFLYSEEVDLCIRAKEAGYLIGTIPSSIVYHAEGGSFADSSSSKRIPFKDYHFLKSNLILTYKHFPAYVFIVKFCFLFRILRRLLNGDLICAYQCFKFIFTREYARDMFTDSTPNVQ